jgi:hypothetical protein
MRAMSLDEKVEKEEENEINHLKTKINMTNDLVNNLNKQVEELKDLVPFKFNTIFELFKNILFLIFSF